MDTPAQDHGDDFAVDASRPFEGIVVCCTSIPPQQRTEIASKVQEMGGIHKYDLTPDCTHLLVGDYATPKYRHVARERPDVRAMDAAWIESVMNLWKRAEPLDLSQLERQYELRPLETHGAEPVSPAESHNSESRGSLLICLTGFGDERNQIEEKVLSAGGKYTGDLTKRCTHLIVHKPEGKKYQAAKQWGVQTVTLSWLNQSVERGMILEEEKFDPLLPVEEQGLGAWVKEDRRSFLGKRSRSLTSAGDKGPRKLRKTASMKLASQSNQIWGDILGHASSKDTSFAMEPDSNRTTDQKQPGFVLKQSLGIFSSCVFAIHGFPAGRKEILAPAIVSRGGVVVDSVQAALDHPFSPSAEEGYRFLVVPQTSQPDSHPAAPDSIYPVTEFYIERCMVAKAFQHPDEHILGRPFPLFPIHGFSDLVICGAGFTGLDLNHISKVIPQLGARYTERFRESTSIMIAKSLDSVRKDKLEYALKWTVPIVSVEWLWECISTGFRVPIDDFIFQDLKSCATNKTQSQPRQTIGQATGFVPRNKSEPTGRKGGIESSVFDTLAPKPSKTSHSYKDDSFHTSTAFVTARTHNQESHDRNGPLTEVPSEHLNRSPSPTKIITPSTALARPPAKVFEPDIPTEAPPPDAGPAFPFDPAATQPINGPLSALANEATEATVHKDGPGKNGLDEKTAAKDAERIELSTKITSLIDPTASLHDPEAASIPQPRPRRRKILGRALSNASSATSLEDDQNPRARKLKRAVTVGTETSFDKTAAERYGLGGEDSKVGDGSGDEDEDGNVPRGTQLEYCDPGALEAKAALMNVIKGGGDAGKVGRGTKASVPVGGPRNLRKR